MPSVISSAWNKVKILSNEVPLIDNLRTIKLTLYESIRSELIFI